MCVNSDDIYRFTCCFSCWIYVTFGNPPARRVWLYLSVTGMKNLPNLGTNFTNRYKVFLLLMSLWKSWWPNLRWPKIPMSQCRTFVRHHPAHVEHWNFLSPEIGTSAAIRPLNNPCGFMLKSRQVFWLVPNIPKITASKLQFCANWVG